MECGEWPRLVLISSHVCNAHKAGGWKDACRLQGPYAASLPRDDTSSPKVSSGVFDVPGTPSGGRAGGLDEPRWHGHTHLARQGDQGGLHLGVVCALKEVVGFENVVWLHTVRGDGLDEVTDVLELRRDGRWL